MHITTWKRTENQKDSMGRYKDLRELRGKRGHGRKAKKQADPALPPTLKAGAETSVPRIKSKLGGRIKQRVRKRSVRMAMLKAMQREKNKKRASKKSEAREGSSDDEGEEVSGAESAGNVAMPFSDENQLWLTPAKSSVRSKDSSEAKTKKRVSFMKADLLEAGSDGNGSEEEQGMMMKHTCANTHCGRNISLMKSWNLFSPRWAIAIASQKL